MKPAFSQSLWSSAVLGTPLPTEKCIKAGLLDVQKRIDTALASLDPLTDSSYLDKKAQLTGMRIACDAMMLYAARYAALAQELAEKESDPQRKSELQTIAANCLTVPAHAPQTFHQALQMYWFMHIGVTTEINPWTLTALAA